MAVAKVIEVISSSTESIEHAIRDGVAKCGETVDNIESVWVKDTKGVVRDNKVVEWRVILAVTFVVR
ncbi:dodecin domain-containing protein [Sphingomonas koreensis]|jgi:dodecin|uniref:Dodecin domain-containing protein n=1 Tax=Sphingomonas koreensis TaxID=93064 RepID=A0A430G1E3_9SPHN|nr:dodecin family protein [Sphingomonas koreensis]RSY81462.1 dodecin domain-containing protein [Sphingomonas koreensis]